MGGGGCPAKHRTDVRGSCCFSCSVYYICMCGKCVCNCGWLDVECLSAVVCICSACPFYFICLLLSLC